MIPETPLEELRRRWQERFPAISACYEFKISACYEFKTVPCRASTISVALARIGKPDSTRPAVVLVHGTPGAIPVWAEVLYGPSGIAVDHEVIAVDLPGHGLSDPLENAKFSDMASVVWEIVSTEEAVVLVGHSYGAETVLRVAASGAPNVVGVVLVSGSGLRRRITETGLFGWIGRIRPLGNLGLRLATRASIRSQLRRSVSDAKMVSAERVELYYEMVHSMGHRAAMVDLGIAEHGLSETVYRSIEVPAHLLWGDRDRLFPVKCHVRKLGTLLAHSSATLIAGVGHLVPEEVPAVAAMQIRGFVDQL